MVKTAHDLYPDKFQWKQEDYEYEFGKNQFDVVSGTDKIRKSIENGTSLNEIKDSWATGSNEFAQLRASFLLY